MTSADEILDEGTRCLLAFRSSRGPLVTPMAYWSDGRELWMTTAHDTVKARVLRRDGACTVYLPPDAGRPGLAAQAQARIFSLADPKGLLLHSPVISAAMSALAARNVPTMVGYARNITRIPARWAPQNRVVVRLTLKGTTLVAAPVAPPGVAPALPTVVPADVRRALTGRRDVAVVRRAADGIEVGAAAWGPGMVLTGADGQVLTAAGPVAVVLDADREDGPVGVHGLVLHGAIAEGGRLRATRATWWRGFSLTTEDLPPAPVGGIELPD